jgi:hypothetical protein
MDLNHLNINFIDSEADIKFRTLSHELGHLFCTDDTDSLHSEKWLFFPQHEAHLDEKVYQNRRITNDVFNEIRLKTDPLK